MIQKLNELEEKFDDLEANFEEAIENISVLTETIEEITKVNDQFLSKLLLLQAQLDAVTELLVGSDMLNQQGIDVITQDNLQALYQDIMTKGELV